MRVHEFLVGDLARRQVPVDLGDISYACVGNTDLCSSGFTVALWIKVDEGHPDMPAQVRTHLFEAKPNTGGSGFFPTNNR